MWLLSVYCFLFHPLFFPCFFFPSIRRSEVLPSVLGAKNPGDVDHVLESRLGFRPATSLQAAVGVDPEVLLREVLEHLLEATGHLLFVGDAGAVDIIQTRPNLVGVAKLLEGTEELEVGLGVLDGQHVDVHALDGLKDVVEI